MTSAPQHIFVYGTLRQGFSTPGRKLLERYGTLVSKGAVPGRLYEIDGLPALVVEQDDGQVTGEVYELDPLGEALGAFDRYEGATGQDPGPYERVVREVELASGGVQEAWMYTWTGGLAGAVPVIGGDYVAYVAGD